MTPAFWLGLWITFWIPVAHSDVPIQMIYEVSPIPLTTESVWNLDPDEPNPHLRIWELERRVVPTGWKTTRNEKGLWQTQLNGIDLRIKASFRAGAGRIYDEVESRFAAQQNAESYERILNKSRPALTQGLSKLFDAEEGLAQEKAEMLFRSWTRSIEAVLVSSERKVKPKGTWLSAPLPTSAAPRLWTQVWARTPAQRVGGRLIVRATIDFGHHTLTGKFLIDTTSEHSLVSPTWLKSMGVPPKILGTADIPPIEINWAGGKTKGTEIHAFETQLANIRFPHIRYWVAETRVFVPPSVQSPCCDGVLGLDFLRKAVFELQPLDQDPVVIWYSRESGDAPSSPDSWVSVGAQTLADGVLMSPCEKGGVRWATAWPESLGFAQGQAMTSEIACPGFTFASGLAGSAQRRPVALTTIGANLILRGRSIFDLGRGRIWFEKSALENPPLIDEKWIKTVNVRFEYFKQRYDRVLRVYKPSIIPTLGSQDWLVSIQDLEIKNSDDWDVFRQLTLLKNQSEWKVKYRHHKDSLIQEVTVRR